MKIHPIAAVVPELSDAEADALRCSIKTCGQLMPILTVDGAIIDGRARYWACKELGVEPKVICYSGPSDETSLLNLVVSANVSRRHLSISQRAAVAANALELFQEQAKRRMANNRVGLGRQIFATPEKGRAAQFAGQMFGVNRVYIQAASNLKEELPAFFAEVLAGTITLSEATRFLKAKGAAQPGKEPTIRRPNLPVPAEAKRLICVWGSEQQVERIRAVAGENDIPYMRADQQDGKWITSEKAVA